MTINAKEFTLARVNPSRTTTPSPPDNAIAGDWEFLCGAESHNISFTTRQNERIKLTDCQDRTSDVVRELRKTGLDFTGSVSGTVENSAAGRWLLETATGGSAMLEDARIYLPGIMYVRSNVLITDFTVTGQDLEGNVTFTANLASSGAVTVTSIALP